MSFSSWPSLSSSGVEKVKEAFNVCSFAAMPKLVSWYTCHLSCILEQFWWLELNPGLSLILASARRSQTIIAMRNSTSLQTLVCLGGLAEKFVTILNTTNGSGYKKMAGLNGRTRLIISIFVVSFLHKFIELNLSIHSNMLSDWVFVLVVVYSEKRLLQ